MFEKLKFFKYSFFHFKKYKQSIYFLSKGFDNRVLAEDTGSFYVWFKISPSEFVYRDLCQKYLCWQVLKSAKRFFFLPQMLDSFHLATMNLIASCKPTILYSHWRDTETASGQTSPSNSYTCNRVEGIALCRYILFLMLDFIQLNLGEIIFSLLVLKENITHIQRCQKISVFLILKYLKVLLTFMVQMQTS